MSLGVELGFGPGDFVLNVDPASPLSPSIFGIAQGYEADSAENLITMMLEKVQRRATRMVKGLKKLP